MWQHEYFSKIKWAKERLKQWKTSAKSLVNSSILDTGPVIGPHLQKATHGHAKPDASSVTQQNIQNHLVPPALGKVRQEMHEEELRKQKNNRALNI